MPSEQEGQKDQVQEKKQNTAEPKPQEEKKAGDSQNAAPQPQKEAPPQGKPKAQEQANCLICNKPIKKLTRYYRNGQFYCSKKCWRTAKEKRKEEKQEAKK